MIEIDIEKLTVKKRDLFEQIRDCSNQKFECESCGWDVPLLGDFRNRRGGKAGCLNCGTWQVDPFYDASGLHGRTPFVEQKTKEAYVFPECHLFSSPCPSCKARLQPCVITPGQKTPQILKCGCGLAFTAQELHGVKGMVEERDPAKLWGMFEKFAEKVGVTA